MRSIRSMVILAALALSGLWSPGASAQLLGPGPWTGLYIGLHGGYAWNDKATSNITGGAGGLHVGYNLQLSSFVVGVEADYSWSAAEERNFIPGSFITANTDGMWSVRSRLGWLIVDSVLVYGTVGYGGFDVHVSGQYTTAFGPVGFTGSSTFDGVVFGGGAEVMITRNLLARAEVLKYQADGSNNVSAATGFLRAGLSYKF